MNSSSTQTSESTPRSNVPFIGHYEKVFIALAVLTAIEVVTGTADMLRWLQVTLLMVFAVAKGVLIVMYFMHVVEEDRPWVIAGVVFLFPVVMGLSLVLTLLTH